MSGRMRRAPVVLWIGFLFQWSPFLLWMLYGTFYCRRRLICSWTFQKCGAEPGSRTGLKVGFFGSPPHLAQYRVTAPTLVLPPLTGNFCLLPVSSASQLRSSFALDLQLHLVPGVFLESAYPGIHAQAPCSEQGWVRPHVSLRKWAGRRSPVLTLLVFYI